MGEGMGVPEYLPSPSWMRNDTGREASGLAGSHHPGSPIVRGWPGVDVPRVRDHHWGG